MVLLAKYSKHIPYLYFIAVILVWFTYFNRTSGIVAYPILLFGIPLLWQIIKPNKTLNLALGFTFIFLSSMLIWLYLVDTLNISSFQFLKGFILFSGIFILSNFIMSAWIIKNTLRQTS